MKLSVIIIVKNWEIVGDDFFGETRYYNGFDQIQEDEIKILK